MPSHFPDHWREPLISSTILQLVPGKTESTTIALLAKLAGLLEPLREFLKTKPVWGSCAGAILMSRAVENAKKGGQELLGGVSVNTLRNGWGSQVIFLYTTFTSVFFYMLWSGRVIRGATVCGTSTGPRTKVPRSLHPCTSEFP